MSKKNKLADCSNIFMKLNHNLILIIRQKKNKLTDCAKIVKSIFYIWQVQKYYIINKLMFN
jgi:hypothetical protein